MRAMWKGSISFGLVNIPVKLFAATEKKNISFRQLHKECGTPIQYEKVCPNCNKKITEEEIVKGYEYVKGQFVIIDDKDLESIPDVSSKNINIVDFVDLAEIDPIYYEKSYFLGPEDLSSKAYLLLRKAMEDSQKIAIAKVVIRSKESLACLRPYGEKHLIMETMFFPDEVRSVDELNFQKEIELHDNELTMAMQLINSLAAEFNPEKYTDEYRKAMLAIIEAKINGSEVSIPVVKQEKVVDLMEALKASLDIAKKEKDKVPVKKTTKRKKAANS